MSAEALFPNRVPFTELGLGHISLGDELQPISGTLTEIWNLGGSWRRRDSSAPESGGLGLGQLSTDQSGRNQQELCTSPSGALELALEMQRTIQTSWKRTSILLCSICVTLFYK